MTIVPQIFPPLGSSNLGNLVPVLGTKFGTRKWGQVRKNPTFLCVVVPAVPDLGTNFGTHFWALGAEKKCDQLPTPNRQDWLETQALDLGRKEGNCGPYVPSNEPMKSTLKG